LPAPVRVSKRNKAESNGNVKNGSEPKSKTEGEKSETDTDKPSEASSDKDKPETT